MRRFQALLISAGLAAAPASAVAGPSSSDPWSSSPTTETLEWSTSKGRLGVLVIGLTPELRKHLGAAEDRGVLVARVEPRTPTASAGIAVGDVIVAVHGHKVDSAVDVLTALSGLGSGQGVTVELVRDRKPLSLNATLSDDAARGLFDAQWSSTRWLRTLRELFLPLTSSQTTQRT